MYNHRRSANKYIGDVFYIWCRSAHRLCPQSTAIIELEALPRDLRVGLPWDLIYTDDLALIAESLEDLEGKYAAWKKGMEGKGMHIKTMQTHFIFITAIVNYFENTNKYKQIKLFIAKSGFNMCLNFLL